MRDVEVQEQPAHLLDSPPDTVAANVRLTVHWSVGSFSSAGAAEAFRAKMEELLPNLYTNGVCQEGLLKSKMQRSERAWVLRWGVFGVLIILLPSGLGI